MSLKKLAKKIMKAVSDELDSRSGLGWTDSVQGDDELVKEIEDAVIEVIEKVLVKELK